MRKRIKKMTTCILTTLLGLSIMNFPVHAQETQANQQVENNSVSIQNMESLFIGESMFKTAVQALTTLDKNAGPFYVEGDSDGWAYDDANKTLTFSKNGTYKVTGDGQQTDVQIVVGANITITLTVENVNCHTSGAGMSINGSSTVTLMLEGKNEFVAGNGDNAGIEFNNATGSLMIDGTGSVTAIGGGMGAGIGGSIFANGANINITGGTVVAESSAGAGIGGGMSGSGENILINKGTITAISYSGAGIGGGSSGAGNNITINGGIITTTSNVGAGIGGGNGKAGSGSIITINGGTITTTSSEGAGIGGGWFATGSSDITITKGSVKATGAEAISDTPTDGNSKPVYLAKLDIADNVNQIKVDGKDYKIQGKHENDTNYYLYMTAGDHYIETESNVYKTEWDTTINSFKDITAPIETGDLKVTGGAYGIDYIYDSSANTLTFNTDGKFTVTGNGITTEQIVIGKNRNIELTIHNVKCHHSGYGAGMEIDGTSTVTLILEGDNEFIAGGNDSAGIEFNNATNGSLTIDGTGSVTAIGSAQGAGIGGFYGSSGNNIIINGGTIVSSSIGGAGIGGANGKSADNIVINGGTVTATSKGKYAIGGDISLTSGTIKILGGSVKAIGNNTSDKDAMGATPTDGVNPVYLAKLDINENVNSIKVDGKDYKIQGKHENDNAYYLYMTAGNHYIETDSNVYFAKWNSSKNAFDPVVIATNDGDLQVEGGTYGIDYMYDDVQNTLTFKKDGNYIVKSKKTEATKERIIVDAGLKMNLTVKNVKCHPATGAGMSIDGSSTVTLMLLGENEFVAGGEYNAGIEFNDATGSLTIDGKGSLTALGQSGAGIGGGNQKAGNNITINGGIITASGDVQSAGIGGGGMYTGSANNITINGGTIKATGNKGGSGIGGGVGGTGSNITITGGNVSATGNSGGAGIGGGYYSHVENITISGGTVTATDNGSGKAGIGDGEGGYGSSNIKITGGSVKAIGKIEAISSTPTNGSDPVQLVTLPNQGGIKSVEVDGIDYKISGNHPDGDANFYLYLTGGDHDLSVDGVQYKALWDSSTSTFSIQPSAPNVEIASQTASTITVKEPADVGIYGDAEYSIDKINWYKESTFTKLNADKSYTVYVRYSGNNNFATSDIGELYVKTSPATYIITIPSKTLTAGNSESKNEISATSMDLGYSGQVNVKVADNGNISKDGKLKLTRMQDIGTTIESALFVNEAAFNDISKYIATFKSTADKPVSISFAKPTEANILAGTYTGTVTFEVTYTQQGG